MDSLLKVKPTADCHLVALPYPGRGHVSALMSLCKQLVLLSEGNNILITYVVTEEWIQLIGSDPKPDNIRFGTIPNVISPEKDFSKFVDAISTELEAPFEQLLDHLEPPVTAIIADTYLFWAVGVGNRRNIPVASFWTMSASVFSVIYHFDLFAQNGHYPIELSERGHEVVDYIPGISPTRLEDLHSRLFRKEYNQKVLKLILEAMSEVSKAQYLLFTSVYELESQVFDVLKTKYPFPVYPIGPTIPHFHLIENSSNDTNNIVPNYIRWLDSQPKTSVLYISFGSFFSVSSVQLDEIVAGIQSSGTRYMWVARDNASKIKDGCEADVGFVVPWCDQLRVLCHPSIGGFLTHCGWNSTLEAIFAGVPMLTFPLATDQNQNSKQIVEDWKVGYKVKKAGTMATNQSVVITRDEIVELMKRFMDPENSDGKEIRKRIKEIQKCCHQAIAKGGSSDTNLQAFLKDILQGHGHC